MTAQEIRTRIDKKEKEIAKIEKRIAKWTKGLRPEDIAVVEPFGEFGYDEKKYMPQRQALKQYKEQHNDIPTNGDDWNKGPDIDEAFRAYLDLGEARRQLEKYKTALAAQNNFDNMEKIETIWKFLLNWKEEATKFFIENAKLYYTLSQNYEKAEKEYFEENPLPVDPNDKYAYYTKMNARRRFQENYYSPIHNVTRQFYIYRGGIDEKALEKYLNEDIKKKYNNLVARITEKAGNIKDASGLRIGGNGEINGVIIGDKNKVRVETITAGGYNTEYIVNVKHGQCLHYRVLVNVIK